MFGLCCYLNTIDRNLPEIHGHNHDHGKSSLAMIIPLKITS